MAFFVGDEILGAESGPCFEAKAAPRDAGSGKEGEFGGLYVAVVIAEQLPELQAGAQVGPQAIGAQLVAEGERGEHPPAGHGVALIRKAGPLGEGIHVEECWAFVDEVPHGKAEQGLRGGLGSAELVVSEARLGECLDVLAVGGDGGKEEEGEKEFLHVHSIW